MKNHWIASIFIFLCVTNSLCSHSTDEWRSRTIYQIITDRFSRTDGSTQGCADLSKYCGGTWKGIENNLDYIQNMGFDAIWISPVPENLGDDYHGYGALDWTKLNDHFGTESDFNSLINALHKRDMWMMVDVVANHVAPVDLDFSNVVPFNKAEYYHDKCQIENWDDPGNVEYCRLANLPDLNQDNSFVRETLKTWIKDLVKKYNIDGLRIDTIPEVKREFWGEYTKSAGCYAVGEVFNGDIGYVASYQGYVPALLNYPMYYTIKDVWMGADSMYKLREAINDENQQFQDATVLGTFTDNHDNPRFLYDHNDIPNYKNAITFALFMQGIPIVYYGTEQGFAGGPDPKDRETLWTNMDTSSDMYKFMKAIVTTRKEHEAWKYPHVESYVNDNFYAFSRGDVLIATTNTHNTVSIKVTYLPESFTEGTIVCNVFYPETDCTPIQNGGLDVVLENGEVKVYTIQNTLVSD